MNKLAAIVTVVGCLHQTGRALQQEIPGDSLECYFRFDDPAPLSCLLTYFPPFFIQHGIDLKAFVRNRIFRDILARYGDRHAVDAIYIRAMQMTNNNTAVALLLATLASFDHRLVGLKIPVFNLFFPLNNESEYEFKRRVRNLPSKLYQDSPSTASGDRDKLQHFFGSAFLTYAFESRGAAMRIGEFIENGEDAFIVDGVPDERDRRANLQGQEFGLALFDDNHRLPSEFLANHSAAGRLPGFGWLDPESMDVIPSRCSGIW